MEGWGAKFSKMSHLHVVTIAYCSLKLSKSIDSTLGQYILQGYLKKISFGWMGRILPKRGYFENFQSSISPLRLMIELRSSLLTYRNSYIAYPKNLFSMTLNFCIKVKWHMCLALVYFRQKGQHNCLRIPPKLLRRHTV